jgi:hypothetical protein
MANVPGRVAIGFFGFCVVCMGIAQFVIGWTESYRKRMQPSWPDGALLRLVARFGLFSKAAVFWTFGALILYSTITERTERPRGLGGALTDIEHAPYGHALITLIAVGLLAYAFYCFLIAWWRDARW